MNSNRHRHGNPWHLACLCLLFFCAACRLGETGWAAETNSFASPNDEFAIQTWTTEDGMPQNIVTAVLQTRAGYLWSASYNGIAQFDGEHFRVFDSSHCVGLTNSRVSSLYEDAGGKIWIGHDTGDLTCYSEGRFEPIPLRAPWSGGTIQGIQADAAGDIWIVDGRGEVMRVRDGLLVKPPPEIAENPSMVPQLALDDEHHLLLARNGYLTEVTPQGCQRRDLPSRLLRPYYARVATAVHGGMWVLGEGRVRRWFRHRWQEDLGMFPWENASVMTTLESTSGRFFVGTLEAGLFIFDPALGWMHLNRSNGLAQDWVRCLAEDREHNIWVGTSGGLSVLRQRSVVMRNAPDNWQGRPVQAIMQARDGAVWAATEGAGLYRMEDNVWTHFSPSNGLANQFVWSVMQDRHGRVWAGTWGGGLFVTEDGSRFTRKFDLAERGLPVTALLESPDDTIWIGTTGGLMRSTQDQIESLASRGGAAAGDVRALAAGGDGALWFGTQGKGLGCYRNGKWQTWRSADGLPTDFILSLYADEAGSLWIGTLDQGVCLYDHGVFHPITTAQGLPNNNIGHIEDDRLGHLWFSSQQGLFRVDRQELLDCAAGKIARVRALTFGKAEGLATLGASSGFTPSGFRAADGRLWFPTAQGMAIVNPRTVRRNPAPPNIWIEDLLVDGQPAKVQTLNHAEAAAQTPTPEKLVVLQPGQRQLEVLFTGLSFTSPDRVQFKYRLEGLDQDWTECGTRRRVTYPFLPPGHYTFRVVARNSDGLWSPGGDAVGLLVLPFFWQTAWFKALGSLACLALVAGVVLLASRRRHRHKLERMSRERELERERARIAQDIHDDLGASLTRIGMLSESATEDLHDRPRATASLGQIYATARDLTRAMDEIVWAVNPRHDTLESLTNYITRFAHDFLSAAHIRCRLDAPMGVPDLIVRSETRHNLFLAFKETLNNAVKHSGASEVRVQFEFTRERVVLVIADNGSGFDPQMPPLPKGDRVVSGYGLNGIRNRLAQVGGHMDVKSQKGEGTSVIFTILMRDMARSAHGHL